MRDGRLARRLAERLLIAPFIRLWITARSFEIRWRQEFWTRKRPLR